MTAEREAHIRALIKERDNMIPVGPARELLAALDDSRAIMALFLQQWDDWYDGQRIGVAMGDALAQMRKLAKTVRVE